MDWTDKCIDEIKRNLGYRFVITRGVYPKSLNKNEKINIKIDIENQGYASPYNARLVELILQNTSTQKAHKLRLEEDPRFWFTDEKQTLNIELNETENIPSGEYELFFKFA